MACLALKRARAPLKRSLVSSPPPTRRPAATSGPSGCRRPSSGLARRRRVRAVRARRHRDAARARGAGRLHRPSPRRPACRSRSPRGARPATGRWPWPDTAPHRLIRALGRLLDAERPPRVLPRSRVLLAPRRAAARRRGEGYDDLERSLQDPRFRARFFANRHHAALVRTTFAVDHAHGKREDQRDPAGGHRRDRLPHAGGRGRAEIRDWVRRVVADDAVEVEITATAQARPTSRRPTPSCTSRWPTRCGGACLASSCSPRSSWAFTDNWIFRRCGLHGYGWSPFRPGRGRVSGGSTATTSAYRSTTSERVSAPTPRCCWPPRAPDGAAARLAARRSSGPAFARRRVSPRTPTSLPEKSSRDLNRRSSGGFAGAISGSLASDGGAPAPRRPAARISGSLALGRRGPSPATSCGSDLRIARSDGGGPSPATSCGSHCVLGEAWEGGRSRFHHPPRPAARRPPPSCA